MFFSASASSVDFLEIVEVVLWLINFFQRPDSQIRWLSIFGALLMLWLIRLWFTTEQRIRLLDVELIHSRDLRVGALPPLQHDLRVVGLRWCLNMWSTKLLYPIGWSIIAADLPLGALFRRFRWIRDLTVFSGLSITFVLPRGHIGFRPRQVHLFRWIHDGVSHIGSISCALELSLKIDLHITLIAISRLYFYF